MGSAAVEPPRAAASLPLPLRRRAGLAARSFLDYSLSLREHAAAL
jgi:hypothetical protein